MYKALYDLIVAFIFDKDLHPFLTIEKYGSHW